MKTLRELYRENKNVETTEKYYSVHYQMTRFDEDHKELDKIHYIKDNKDKLARIRQILSKKVVSSGYVPPRDNDNWQTYYSNYPEYEEATKKGLFFGCWVWLGLKRELELQNYLDAIVEKADKLAKTDETTAINYLIDEKYNYHTGILDVPKDDFIFRGELNQIIFDYLQLKINDITNDVEPQPFEPIQPKKPFKWNGNKQSLGTLFGMLFNYKIIEGNVSDFQRQLLELFQNAPATSTLKDNIYLKIDGDKKKYCTETEDLLTDWITFLAKTTPQNQNN